MKAILRANAFLAWLACYLGVATVFASVAIVVRTYSPVLFADDWRLPLDYIDLGGRYPIARLWMQHNEHRFVFQKMLELFSMYWLHGDHLFLFVLSGLVQAAHCGITILILRRLGGLDRLEWLTAAGLASFFIFNPLQMEIFVWGFGPTFLGCFLLSAASIGSMAVYGLREREKRPSRVWLAASLTSAALAECCLAGGNVVWLVLPVCAVLMGVPVRRAAAVAGVGALGIGIYLIGYRTPPVMSDPVSSARHIADVAEYVQSYFAESWHYILPTSGGWLAVIAIGAMAAFPLAQEWWRAQERPAVQVYAVCLAIFAISTALITALGRQKWGSVQAHSGRYQANALLFWYAATLILITLLGRLERWRAVGLMALQLAICAAMGTELSRFPDILRYWEADAYAKNRAGLTLELGVADAATVSRLGRTFDRVAVPYKKLVSMGLLTPPFPEDRTIGRRIDQVFPIRVADCEGYASAVTVVTQRPLDRDVTADGWARLGRGETGFRRLFATTGDGYIVGFGVTNRLSWHLVATVPNQAASISLYGLMPAGNSVCLIPPAIPVPAPR